MAKQHIDFQKNDQLSDDQKNKVKAVLKEVGAESVEFYLDE